MRYIKFVLLVSILLMLVSIYPFAQETIPQADIQKEAESLGIVLDLERPSNTDILLLRNGDKLTGTVLNESFSIRTSYSSLKFNNRIIAGIDLEGGANNIEAIVTVNDNRFSGFIDDPFIVFKLQTGPQIEIRREKILKVIFRVREAERTNIPQSQFVVLKNGDYFSGKILNENLIIATTYAKVPLDLNDVDSVTMIGGDNPLTKVLMRNNDIIQGVLETEDINVDLDIGDQINIYQDRINIFYCRTGFVPDVNIIGSIGVVALSSEVDNFEISLPGGCILIVSVPESSEYYGHLQPEDRIIAIDGKPYENGMMTPLRKELIAGKRAQMILTVSRGDKKFLLKLIKK